MKKLLLALALLFLPVTAHAGVSCSVPFNLTNGTTADATQVMANYNAILACLSTSTAHSGANTDITSLGGLTTPITPAQGGAIGLCGVTGLKMVNNTGTPNTEIDITFSQALVVNSLAAVQYGTSGSLTLNLGTAGVANGLDAGSLGASTVYNIFLIGNGTAIASLASLSATAPILPSGYSYSCRIAAWETGTGSALLTLSTLGNKTMLRQGASTNLTAGALQFTTSPTGSCANFSTDTMVLTTFAGIPPTAGQAVGVLKTGTTGSAFVSSFGTSVTLANEIGGAGVGNVPFDLNLPAASSIYLCLSNGGSPAVSILGWVDTVNAH